MAPAKLFENFLAIIRSTSSLTPLLLISTPAKVALFTDGAGSGGTVMPLITSYFGARPTHPPVLASALAFGPSADCAVLAVDSSPAPPPHPDRINAGRMRSARSLVAGLLPRVIL
jgi:hypothetical protein